MNRVRPAKTPTLLADDPLWYKDAVIYEVHVRAFCDSNGDGIGDFPGLTSKLDYLQDLGVTAIWLLPFYPSPLRDDGYDIADYTNIHPNYGTLADFKVFIREAHRRGLRVITELVCNHTSDQHPWFQRARRAKPGTSARNFYVWSDTPDRYKDARIIFKDFETSNWTWDPVAQAYYWHRFYSHQPDLNFENPAVQRAVFKAMEFWLDLGVDGMRLDAIPYLYEAEGTNCENLPETHAFLKRLRKHMDEKYQGRMFLAEANQWPWDLRPYFGEGDEFHLAFHFPLMPRLYLALLLYPLSAQAAHEILERFRIRKEYRDLVLEVRALAERIPLLSRDVLRPSEIVEALDESSDEARLALRVAEDNWLVRQRLDLYQRRLQHIRPALTGDDLRRMGVEPGPIYRSILSRLRSALLDGEISTPAQEVELVRRLLAALTAGKVGE